MRQEITHAILSDEFLKSYIYLLDELFLNFIQNNHLKIIQDRFF